MGLAAKLLASVYELNEAAYRRAKARRDVESLEGHVTLHLALVHLFPDNPARTPWLVELSAAIAKMRRLSRGKKGIVTLDRDFLIDLFWESPFGDPEDRAGVVRELAIKMRTPDLSTDGLEVPEFKALVMRFIDAVLAPEFDRFDG